MARILRISLPGGISEYANMCSVGDMFDVDISGEATVCEYICRDCGNFAAPNVTR